MSYDVMYANLRDGVYDNPLPCPRIRDGRREYRQKEREIQEEFKQDLFKAYKVENNPKKDRCYALAWEHGHSSGLFEVLSYFDDLVDLIKED